MSKFRDYMRLRHLALSTEQSYLAWLGRYMRFLASVAEDLPTSEEKVEVLIEDHRRMSFLEAHGGTISHGENGFRTCCPGSLEKPQDFPCIFTEGFPTIRESISDAMSQVKSRRAEWAQERRRWVELRRMISGAEAGGK